MARLGVSGFQIQSAPPASPVFQDPFIEPERRRHVDAGCAKRQEAERGPVLNQEKLAEWRPAMQRAAADVDHVGRLLLRSDGHAG